MPYVLADQNSWLEKGKDPFEFKVLNSFENMINSVRWGIPKIQMSKRIGMGQQRHLCGNILQRRNTMTLVDFVTSAIFILRNILEFSS
jgi:hypothetical protein